MKRILIAGLSLATLLFSISANAYDIKDTYIGENDHGWGDVIGATSLFDIKGLNASISGSVLTVDIFTNYAGEADNGHYSSLTQTKASGWGNGIGYGDLFLSSRSAGDWTHGFSLDDRWSETGGDGTLYATNGHFLYSDDFLSSGVYRNGYEVAVDTEGGAVALSSGNWSVNEDDGYLSFKMELAGTGLLENDKIYFGWEYTCANDVIHGSLDVDKITDVPEPGALGLAGLGLIGTFITRRRNKSV